MLRDELLDGRRSSRASGSGAGLAGCCAQFKPANPMALKNPVMLLRTAIFKEPMREDSWADRNNLEWINFTKRQGRPQVLKRNKGIGFHFLKYQGVYHQGDLVDNKPSSPMCI